MLPWLKEEMMAHGYGSTGALLRHDGFMSLFLRDEHARRKRVPCGGCTRRFST